MLVPKQKQKRMCQDTTKITTHTIHKIMVADSIIKVEVVMAR